MGSRGGAPMGRESSAPSPRGTRLTTWSTWGHVGSHEVLWGHMRVAVMWRHVASCGVMWGRVASHGRHMGVTWASHGRHM
eukprot:4480797-Prymnesium_polylepis.1